LHFGFSAGTFRLVSLMLGVAVINNPPCIICLKFSAISGSHVVPNFFVRYIKQNTPVPHLIHSTDRSGAKQDGWKGPYLCKTCETTVSKWETDLAHVYRKIIAMRTTGSEAISISDNLWFAIASIHLRWLCHACSSDLNSGCAAFINLYSNLHTACDRQIRTPGAHLYLSGFEKVTQLGPYIRPGFNSYAFMSIDGGAFDYEDADGHKQVMCWLKPPGLCLVASSGPLANLYDHPLDVSSVSLEVAGQQFTPLTIPSTFWKLFGAYWDNRVSLIQEEYSTFDTKRLERIATWAKSKKAPLGALEWHNADLELLKVLSGFIG
jgi:hypothetical protein